MSFLKYETPWVIQNDFFYFKTRVREWVMCASYVACQSKVMVYYFKTTVVRLNKKSKSFHLFFGFGLMETNGTTQYVRWSKFWCTGFSYKRDGLQYLLKPMENRYGPKRCERNIWLPFPNKRQCFLEDFVKVQLTTLLGIN